MATTDDTGVQFLIALIAGPMIGWALGYFIRKSIKVIAFIGGMFFFIIGVLHYSRTIDSLSVLQEGVGNTIEIAINRTVDISNQAIADSGGILIFLTITPFSTGASAVLRRNIVISSTYGILAVFTISVMLISFPIVPEEARFNAQVIARLLFIGGLFWILFTVSLFIRRMKKQQKGEDLE